MNALERNADILGVGMFVDVGQTFLYQTIGREIQWFGKAIQGAAGVQAKACMGQPLTPLVDAMFDRRDQTKLVEPHGPKAPDHVGDRAVDMVGRTHDRLSALQAHLRIMTCALLDRKRIQFDRIDRLAELIVQFTRQPLVLNVKDPQILLCQFPVLREHRRDSCFGPRAPLELTLDMSITPPRQPHETEQEHDHADGPFIELQRFDAACGRI
jgi:hypothetical protein